MKSRLFLKKVKWLFPEILVFLLLFSLFSFRLPSSYHFDSDFGRDLMWMYDIAHGKITLLGPKLSFGGYHLGPYYYYLFVPFFVLSKFFPWGVLLGNAFIFAFLTTVVFYLFRSNWGFHKAFLSILILSLTPFYLYSARSPGNAFSYLPFLLLFISLLSFYPHIIKKKAFSAILGFLFGFILNFHPVSFLYLLPFCFLHFIFYRKYWKQTFLFFVFGVVESFTPLILFELKHNFIMFKNTFVYKSYKVFTQGSSPASITKPSKNPIINLSVINKLSKGQIWPQVLILFLLNLFLFKFAQKSKITKLAFYSFSFTLGLFSILLRFQVASHYLFPLYLSAVFSTMILLADVKTKYSLPFLYVWAFLVLMNFPKHLYLPARRNFNTLWQDTKILEGKLPAKNFNIVVIRETPLAILGYEYRYILRLLGYKSDGEFSYNRSKYLLVVSEKGEINVEDYKSWELDQFGKKILIKKIKAPGRIFYLFKKA